MKPSNPSRRDLLKTSGALMAGALISPAAPIPSGNLHSGELTVDEVLQAIERAKTFLRGQQQPDGTWPNRLNYDNGLTPLCVLALLTAGCAPDDETIVKAMPAVRAYSPFSTYSTSIQTMVLCAVEPDRDRGLILRNVQWLQSRQVQEGPERGMWATPSPGSTDHIDNSMTHFAMLGLYEAERIGVAINPRTWRMALRYWRQSQNADGSWGWSHDYQGTGSMTCAGIAALLIASGSLGSEDARVEGDEILCCGQQQSTQHFDKAIGWLEHNFSVTRNPQYKFWHSYYLYSLERAGRMTARRFIGRHDWYREGARLLLETQRDTGAWPSDEQFDHKEDQCVSTSFSLMFLAKGQRPVLVAHLKHDPHDDWNRHRGALFNLVDHASVAWRRPLTYQIVDLSAASVEDLLESPVLYVSGRDTPQWSDDDLQKLRMYVDRGGFLFAEQCCGGGDFDVGLRRALEKMFPEPDRALRLLPPGHAVWFAERQVDSRYLRELWGIDVGCRTGVIYCPGDLSCYWELARLGRDRDWSQSVRDRVAAAMSIGLNVLAYATGREVKYKSPTAPKVEREDPRRRGKLQVAAVLMPGGCDAAPAAIRNLMRLVSERYGAPATLQPGEVRLTDESLSQYPLVFLHGRTSFRWTPAERAALRRYLERGGTAFADALCSSAEFAASLRRELKEMFPEQPLRRIPVDDPLLTPQFGGESLATVSRRQRQLGAARGRDALVVRHGEPALESLTLDGRHALIFSPYDVSCALESHGTLDCEGYAREDAVRIAMNVLLYACQ
ncbi:MAG: DUF4159 domain-containing protein [Thermoguttaceae bacterium]